MKIIADLSAEVPDTNAHHLKLEEFADDEDVHFLRKNMFSSLGRPLSVEVLHYGYNASKSAQTEGTKAAFFNNWMPCEFAQAKDHNGKDALNYDEKFDLVYGICPYTVEWLNRTREHARYRYGFYPFHSRIIPERQEKKYDVIYHGGIHGKEHEDCLGVISKFKYQYCTMTHHINERTQLHVPLATRTNLPFLEKIKLVGQCKMSVCYNIVHNEERHKKNIMSYPAWSNNEAFLSEGMRIMPQFKTRMHEAAVARTLNLVYRDPWNVAEDYYEPEKEFLYFSTSEELEELVEDVIYDWEDYEPIVEAAYERAMNYTADKFVKLVESGESWKGRER